MKKVLSICEISKLLGVHDDTVRTYLGNFRFNKFLTRKESEKKRLVVAYYITEEFINKLSDFLKMKRRYKILENIKNLKNGDENESIYNINGL